VRWPLPWRAVRAATAIRSRRMVAARAFAKGRLARAPAARSRLCAMAAMDSQAALAAKTPEGHVSERAAGDVGEDLLHDRVVAVLPLGLDELERRVGEHRVLCRAACYADPGPGLLSWAGIGGRGAA
jgi:hypothetical protein